MSAEKPIKLILERRIQRVVLHGSKLVDEAQIAICRTDTWISTALRRINSYIILEQGSTHSQLITLTAQLQSLHSPLPV